MNSFPLVIAGSGRSGTTWVLDAIADANKLRPIFEPLNPLGVPEARTLANRYVRDNTSDPELKLFMYNIFYGKLNSLWPNYRFRAESMRPSINNMCSLEYNYFLLSRYKNFLKMFVKYVKRKSFRPITKFIRANLMLGWLATNFDAKIILIVRHPGAVAASKIAASKGRGGEVWASKNSLQQSLLRQYQRDELLCEDFLYKYKAIFFSKLSPLAEHTVMWCIENVLPIYKAQQSGRCVVFYEDLVVNPESEFDRITKTLCLESIPDNYSIIRPSQQASIVMKCRSFDAEQVNRWTKSFCREQFAEIDEVLKFFNVVVYDAYESMPTHRLQDRL